MGCGKKLRARAAERCKRRREGLVRRREGRVVGCLWRGNHCQEGRHVLQDHVISGLGARMISEGICELKRNVHLRCHYRITTGHLVAKQSQVGEESISPTVV